MTATSIDERALGPDLTRGVMLLCIALANSHHFLDAPEVLGGFPRDTGPVGWAIATFVDGRAFPLFGVLFGYGVAQVVRRRAAAGRGAVRRLLWRRAGMLVAIGFIHAIALYVGDILAAYGVLLAVGAWAVFWRDRWLLVWAALFLALTALPADGALDDATTGPGAAELPDTPGIAVTERLQAQPFIMLLGPIGFACPYLLGLWAGRRRILERPGEHRGWLALVAVAGIAAGVLGAQPFALMVAGASSADDFAAAQALHTATGTLGGAGYAAALALLSVRLARSPGRLTRALQATGQRSMTCYLAQSLVWTLVFTPFLLGLAGRLTVAGTALLAIATWAATVVLADALARGGRRGPFEVLLRRATYGRGWRQLSASREGSRPCG